MKKRKVATHSWFFHTDDVFAVATLSLVFGLDNLEIVRTRDPRIIGRADIVVDVGTVHDPEKDRFDHHQIGGAGERANGIPYASFGLVWLKYGAHVPGSSEPLKEVVDKRLVQSVDSLDNGKALSSSIGDVRQYALENAIESFNNSSAEEKKGKDNDDNFIRAVNFAREIIEREIAHARDVLEGREYIENIYKNTDDKRLLVIDKVLPWKETVEGYEEPLYVVYPYDKWWVVRTVNVPGHPFTNKKDLPKGWAGKKDEDMAKASGVKDAFFCHNSLFIASARSKEGAIELAKRALSS